MRFSWLVTAGVCAWLVACGSSNHKKALICDASECGPDLGAGAPNIGEGGAPSEVKDAGSEAKADAGAPPDEPDAGMPQAGESGGAGELTLEIEGNGAIAVTDEAACLTSPCSYPAAEGKSFALLAKPGADSRFVGWSGDCAGAKGKSTVIVTVHGAAHCLATFVVLRAVAAAVSADGGGSVLSKPDLSCNAEGCKGDVDDHSSVTLSATADAGYGFVQWTGSPECDGLTKPSITLQVTEDLACNALFAKELTVSVSAVGANAQVGVAAGTCDALSCTVAANESASFHAALVPGYRFTGWSGGPLCTGLTNPLVIEHVLSEISCVANYTARLTVTGLVGGALAGTVEASSAALGSNCLGNSCTLDAGSIATLKAPSISGYALSGWSGAGCLVANQSGSGITVTPTTGNVTCTANYSPGLSVSGTVIGAVGTVGATAISTSATCSAGTCVKVSPGDSVTLTAPTIAAFRFTGWSGDAGCTGTAAPITLTNVTSSKSCAANYVQQFTIAGVAGVGGTVSAKNGATTCAGNSCTVDAGTSVALSALPDAANGYHFVTWSGASCTPAANSPLTLSNVNTTCSASFALDTFTIAATAGTNGSVSATRGDTNMTCAGSSCTVNYGVNVSLAAAPAANYHFNGWAGAGCAPPGSTPISLKNANISCSAAFAINTFSASVSARPQVRAPFGITCPGNDCGAVPYGQLVNVTAAAAAGWSFAGWSASCGGGTASPNPVTITGNTACVASFRPIATAVTSPSGSGSITATGTGNPVCSSGDPAKCTIDVAAAVTFVVKPAANAVFTGWTGDCAGTSTTATLTSVSAPKSCVANFYRLWAQSTGAKGDESINQVVALADGSVVGLGVTLPSGKIQNLTLVDLDANTGKLKQAQQFVDGDGVLGFTPLGLTPNFVQKDVIALAYHAATKQPYLYDRGAKWDLEYDYSGGGAAVALGGAVISTLDGGIAFAVGVQDTNAQGVPLPTAGHLTKVDAAGKPVFDVQFCAKDASGKACITTVPVDLLQDSASKTYVVLSQASTPADSLVLTFVSEAGAVLGSTSYTDSQTLTAAQFAPGASADSYLVVGTRTDAKGTSNAFFGEFNRAPGTPRFVYQVNTDTVDKHLFSVAKTAGGYALAGLFNDAKQLNEAWLVLIDDNGGIKSQLAYGGPLGDRANTISSVPAGGFVLGGVTSNWTQGNADMWALRLDGTGAITFDTTLTPKPLTYATAFAPTAIAGIRPGVLGFGVTDSAATPVKPNVKAGSTTYGQIAETP